MRSPAHMVGLCATFWTSSPAKITLNNISARSCRHYCSSEGSRKALKLEPSSLVDESDWVDADTSYTGTYTAPRLLSKRNSWKSWSKRVSNTSFSSNESSPVRRKKGHKLGRSSTFSLQSVLEVVSQRRTMMTSNISNTTEEQSYPDELCNAIFSDKRDEHLIAGDSLQRRKSVRAISLGMDDAMSPERNVEREAGAEKGIASHERGFVDTKSQVRRQSPQCYPRKVRRKPVSHADAMLVREHYRSPLRRNSNRSVKEQVRMLESILSGEGDQNVEHLRATRTIATSRSEYKRMWPINAKYALAAGVALPEAPGKFRLMQTYADKENHVEPFVQRPSPEESQGRKRASHEIRRQGSTGGGEAGGGEAGGPMHCSLQVTKPLCEKFAINESNGSVTRSAFHRSFTHDRSPQGSLASTASIVSTAPSLTSTTTSIRHTPLGPRIVICPPTNAL